MCVEEPQMGVEMNQILNTSELLNFYKDHLQTVLLPFWLEHSIDFEDGGYYTCFDGTGKNLVSTDKYTWSQGRMIWILSKLACMENKSFSKYDTNTFIELASLGVKFLIKNCLLENGNCTFLMDKKGNPKPQAGENELDSSIYADCFVVCGLSQYFQACKDKEALEFAIKLYMSIVERIDTNTFKSQPYPVPIGYKVHAIYMILLNTSQELEAALNTLEDKMFDHLKALVKSKIIFALSEITGNFIREDGLLYEMIDIDNNKKDSLLGNYINPGHTIEDMWFIIHAAINLNNNEYITKACNVIKKTFEIGWDQEFGGLFTFIDNSGCEPKGDKADAEGCTMHKKILSDWNFKLWWPHSEALYSTLLCYEQTKDPSFLELYWKTHHYTFKTFPNPDKSIGEWIQIRDRSGAMVEKVVALPVKDPYHIIRNFILIIELLSKLTESTSDH